VTRLGVGRKLPGVNIQWPWSALLLSGEKTIETRSYAIPDKYIGKELAIIETPGRKGKKEAGIDKARIIGTIVFGPSYKYETMRQWQLESAKHRVTAADRDFSFNPKKPKWAWPVLKVKSFKKQIPPPKRRGIVFATECNID
jgi:hypothetical protein